jgi:NitT/TauT family transport system ATP-binding protein
MITHDVREAVFLSQRIYVLSTQPGTIEREYQINLPSHKPVLKETPSDNGMAKSTTATQTLRDYHIKRQPAFHQQADEITDLLRNI